MRTVLAMLAAAVLAMGFWLFAGTAGTAGAEELCVEVDATGLVNAHPARLCREILLPTTCVTASVFVPGQSLWAEACVPD